MLKKKTQGMIWGSLPAWFWVTIIKTRNPGGRQVLGLGWVRSPPRTLFLGLETGRRVSSRCFGDPEDGCCSWQEAADLLLSGHPPCRWLALTTLMGSVSRCEAQSKRLCLAGWLATHFSFMQTPHRLNSAGSYCRDPVPLPPKVICSLSSKSHANYLLL